jgi:hypothetical protein
MPQSTARDGSRDATGPLLSARGVTKTYRTGSQDVHTLRSADGRAGDP